MAGHPRQSSSVACMCRDSEASASCPPYALSCRKKYGDAYTLNVLGREMTFLHDPKDLETFFGAPSDRIAFQPAVEQWTFVSRQMSCQIVELPPHPSSPACLTSRHRLGMQRIFGVDSDEFFPNHHHVLHFLRSSFTPSALPSILLPMANSALRHVDELLLPSGKVRAHRASCLMPSAPGLPTLCSRMPMTQSLCRRPRAPSTSSPPLGTSSCCPVSSRS